MRFRLTCRAIKVLTLLARAVLYCLFACGCGSQTFDFRADNDPLPTRLDVIDPGRALLGVATDGHLWVIVGEFGMIRTSADGLTWEREGKGTTSASLWAIANDGHRWVAVGSGGAIVTSTDGFTWELKGKGITSGDLQAVASDGHRWVAVGSRGAMVTSTDGLTWELAGKGIPSAGLRAVANDGHRWVAVGSGTVVTSTDGLTWELEDNGVISSVIPAQLSTVASDGHRWVAVGSGTVVTSTDGLTWELEGKRITSASLRAVASDGHQWLAVGVLGTIVTSTDGLTWEPEGKGITLAELLAVASDGHRWVAVGSDGAIVTSVDGLTWELEGKDVPAAGLCAIASDRHRWVAVGSDGVIVTSTDGLTWELKGKGITSGDLQAVASDGHRWVAVGDRGVIVTSTDGLTWELKGKGITSGDLRAVASDGHRWVAVGHHGAIVTSTDGLRWDLSGKDIKSTYLDRVASDGHRWVAVGGHGAIVASTDGLSWEFEGNGITSADLRAVASDGHRWVSVGDEGAIVTSVDGFTWELEGNGITPASLLAVASDGHRWAAVGSGGVIVTSTDGLTWELTRGKAFWIDLNAIASDGHQWLAVGEPLDGSDGYGLAAVTSTNGRTWAVMEVRRANALAYRNGQWVAVPPLASISNGDPVSELDGVRFEFTRGVADAIVHVEPAGHVVEDVSVQIYAQNAFDFETKHEPLQPVSDAVPLDLKPGVNTFRIPTRIRDLLGGLNTFYFSIELTDNGWVSRYPRYDEAKRATYDPKPPAWLWPISAWWVLHAILLCAATTYGVYLWNPLKVLAFRRWLGSLGPAADLKVPFVDVKIIDLAHSLNLFLVPCLARKPRTLRAWVEANYAAWAEEFDGQATAAMNLGYEPLPCWLGKPDDGELVSRPNPDFGRRLFRLAPSWGEIIGSGGAGKTMLGIQLCRWALAGDLGGRKLPVLIEEDTQDILQTVRRKLTAKLGEAAQDNQLISDLLQQGYILIMFDRLSERQEATFKYVEQIQGRQPLGAVIVTTRRPGSYEGVRPAQIYPMPLRAQDLMFFMACLLAKPEFAGGFSRMRDQTTLASRLADVITFHDREIPLVPLLVRVFVEDAAKVVKDDPSLDGLPKSVPAAYLNYLRGLQPEKGPGCLSQDDLIRVAKAIAAECLERDFIPRDIPADRARQCFTGDKWKSLQTDPIESLISAGVLKLLRGRTQDTLAFALDPMAEYLGAGELLDRREQSIGEIQDLFARVRKIGEPAAGFLVALELTAEDRGLAWGSASRSES